MRSVEAKFDQESGKLRQLTLGPSQAAKSSIFSHMDGGRFLHIEIDLDGDGKTDRWEYFNADQTVDRVGFSRSNDGVADAWALKAPDGSLDRVEVSTKRDGKPNRTEFYEKGVMTRAEEDTDTDGQPDKWEQYESGVLVSVSFDTERTGKPTTTINYRQR